MRLLAMSLSRLLYSARVAIMMSVIRTICPRDIKHVTPHFDGTDVNAAIAWR